MDDERQPPSSDLVPETEAEMDPLEGGYETPDAFDTPMDEDTLENELPEEGVSPEDVAFAEELEGDMEGENGAAKNREAENRASEGAAEGDGDSTDPYGGDTDFEQDLEDEDIERFSSDER